MQRHTRLLAYSDTVSKTKLVNCVLHKNLRGFSINKIYIWLIGPNWYNAASHHIIQSSIDTVDGYDRRYKCQGMDDMRHIAKCALWFTIKFHRVSLIKTCEGIRLGSWTEETLFDWFLTESFEFFKNVICVYYAKSTIDRASDGAIEIGQKTVMFYVYSFHIGLNIS